MEVSSGRWQDENVVAVDEFGKDSDRVVESSFVPHIRGC